MTAVYNTLYSFVIYRDWPRNTERRVSTTLQFVPARGRLYKQTCIFSVSDTLGATINILEILEMYARSEFLFPLYQVNLDDFR